MKRSELGCGLLVFLSCGCGDGDGFDPPQDVPSLRVQASAVWEDSGPWATVEVFNGADQRVSGATVTLRANRHVDATEYPAGSGVYRVAPGVLDWDSQIGLEVDAGTRGYVAERRHTSPDFHDVESPLPFSVFGDSGFDVRWDDWGDADAAEVRLRRNGDESVGPDDGIQHVQGGYDESTREEYVEVRRWREFALEDALPGSQLHLEVRRSTGPISVGN